jgi:TPR repeat protein
MLLTICGQSTGAACPLPRHHTERKYSGKAGAAESTGNAMSQMTEDENLLLDDDEREPGEHGTLDGAAEDESLDENSAYDRLIRALASELGESLDEDEDSSTALAEAVESDIDWEAIADPFDDIDRDDLDAAIDALAASLGENRAPKQSFESLTASITDDLIRNRVSEGGERSARANVPLPSPPDGPGRIALMLGADRQPVRRVELGGLPLIQPEPAERSSGLAALYETMAQAQPKVSLQTRPSAQMVPEALLEESEESAPGEAEVEETAQEQAPEAESLSAEAEAIPPASLDAVTELPADWAEDETEADTADNEAEDPLAGLVASPPLQDEDAPAAGEDTEEALEALQAAHAAANEAALAHEQAAARKAEKAEAKARQRKERIEAKIFAREQAKRHKEQQRLERESAIQEKRAAAERRKAEAASRKAHARGIGLKGAVIASTGLIAVTGTAVIVLQDQPAIHNLLSRGHNPQPQAVTTTPATIPSLATHAEPLDENSLPTQAALPDVTLSDLEALATRDPSRGEAEIEAANRPDTTNVPLSLSEATTTAEQTNTAGEVEEEAVEVASAPPTEAAPLAKPAPATSNSADTTTTSIEQPIAETPLVSDQLPAELEALQQAALKGNRQAQHDLGAHYAAGRLVEQDFRKAAYWFQEAAIRGVANAQYNLGVLFQQGLGVDANPALAVQWYERAAQNGHLEAQYNMGVAYADGIGVDRNFPQAVRWFERAASAGIARAAYNLGVMYELGMLGAPDLDAARQWYRQAATSGERDAVTALERLNNRG